ncbi:undecaprenyl-phosphate glucose phosphotransferase [Flavicella sp.]|uniref:undecaprenyl-phosphate glucose phosphotransferase n=1 Tax=Flavicella sp. TaxID=2957742 RepID=UPI00301AE863
MLQGKSKYVPLLSAIVDVILMIFAFFVAKKIVFEGVLPEKNFYGIAGLGCVILWVVIALKMKLYELPRIIYAHKVLSRNILAVVVYAFLSGGLIFFITDCKYSRMFLTMIIVAFFGFILLWRIVIIFFLKRYRRSGYNYRKILLVGFNDNMCSLIKKVYLNPNYGFQIVGLFTDRKVDKNIEKYHIGKISEVFNFLKSEKLDEIVVSLERKDPAFIIDLLQYADNNLVRVKIIPEFSEYLFQSFVIEYIENIPILQTRKEPLQSLVNRMFKRVFDFVFSLGVILFVFSWLFPLIALIIKATSKGPVFFVQERTGKDGVSFKCFKFRSMTVNSRSDKLQATRYDHRITSFGAFMRRTSIDELPQILNVLLNQMSLVGPRPHMLKHTDEYRLLVDKFMVRHFAKPGITGWAQINGFRGETKMVKDMENRAKYDIWYIENWSFLLDMKIVFSTVLHMFYKKDKKAY